MQTILSLTDSDENWFAHLTKKTSLSREHKAYFLVNISSQKWAKFSKFLLRYQWNTWQFTV